jgi:hypothetical protein
MSQIAVRFNDLFQVEVKPDYIGALKFIKNCRSCPWSPHYCSYSKSKQREKVIMLNVSSKILAPLCREVVLESSYWEILGEQMTTELNCGDIGMGSVHTWHGTPDVRVRGVEVVCRRETEERVVVDEDPSDDESLASSDEATTTIEGKVHLRDANLQQAVGTCVISSFTEKSLHPNKQAMVPTILIDEAQFRVCFYDCEKDVLLVSESKSLATKGGLSKSGIALLWIVINHRLFLQQLPGDFAAKYPANIKSTLEASGELQHYTSLKLKNVNWNRDKGSNTVKNSDLPVMYMSLKRRRV